MRYTITVADEDEPANAGPDWYPQERTVGEVEALNDRQALRKARKLYGPTAAVVAEP